MKSKYPNKVTKRDPVARALHVDDQFKHRVEPSDHDYRRATAADLRKWQNQVDDDLDDDFGDDQP